MNRIDRLIQRLAVTAALCAVTGCVMIPDADSGWPAPVSDAEGPETAVEHAADAAVEISTIPEPPAAPVVPRPPRRVLVLVADSVEVFPLLGLVARLEAERFEVELASTSAPAPGPDSDPPGYVIAVGSGAARAAFEHYEVPIVFCQIVDVGFEPAAGHYGVSAVPPLALQLRAWKALSPQLSRVALVLSAGADPLAREATAAADAIGITLDLRRAASDREAVYLFRRMAAEVDGLWLLPDNAVLSPRAIREMLEHADGRQVQTLAFTPTLFGWGAQLSATGTDEDLVRTLVGLVDRLANGRVESLPPITPLTELELRINPEDAGRFSVVPDSKPLLFGRDDS